MSNVKFQINTASSHKILKIDIKDFYRTISHEILIEKMRKYKFDSKSIVLVQKALNRYVYDRDGFHGVLLGVPEGISISNTLAFLYLIDFDVWTSKKFDYFRFVDDILIIPKTPELFLESVYSDISQKLYSEYKLETHDLTDADYSKPPLGKTGIHESKIGFLFLGYQISSDDITIKDKSVERFYSRIFGIINRAKKNNGQLTSRDKFRINLKISGCKYNGTYYGFVTYFIHITNTKQLSHFDHELSKKLKRWGLDFPERKRLLKAFYQMKYSRNISSYFPDFDKIGDQKRRELLSLFGVPGIEEMDKKKLRIEFDKIIGSEALGLEKDQGSTHYNY